MGGGSGKKRSSPTRVYLVDRSYQCFSKLQGDTKKREPLKNPTKIEEIQKKKIIDRN